VVTVISRYFENHRFLPAAVYTKVPLGPRPTAPPRNQTRNTTHTKRKPWPGLPYTTIMPPSCNMRFDCSLAALCLHWDNLYLDMQKIIMNHVRITFLVTIASVALAHTQASAPTAGSNDCLPSWSQIFENHGDSTVSNYAFISRATPSTQIELEK